MVDQQQRVALVRDQKLLSKAVLPHSTPIWSDEHVVRYLGGTTEYIQRVENGITGNA
jgi:hypothetical protein